MKGLPSQYEAVRQSYVDRIPEDYRWWAHCILQFTVGAIVFGAAVSRMKSWHFMLMPLFLLIANLIEWYYHKNLMHHVMWGLRSIMIEHVGEHHSVFITGNMAVRSAKELHAVLLAPISMFVAYGFMLIPAGIAYLIYRPVAYAWVAASALYLVSYELLHLIYHLPVNGPFQWLRKRHELHHDPRLMQKYNFNVTIPIWDVLLGTYKG